MFYVYILFCNDRKLYIGFTRNLKKRITVHKTGGVKSTRNRRPLKLVYYEAYLSKSDAEAREVYLKSGGGHQQIRAQHKKLLGDWNYLHTLPLLF